MKTTLNKIRAYSPCVKGWSTLLMHLGKSKADNEPLSIETIIDSNGIEDAVWCLRAVEGYDREIRLFAIWCARQVQHLMSDPRSIAALDVAERFANGEATDCELLNACTDTYADADAAAAYTFEQTARTAAHAARADSYVAACAAAYTAAHDAAYADAYAVCIDDYYAAYNDSYNKARATQAQKLREICAN